MALTVRLEPELEAELSRAAQEEGLSKSDFTRRCLEEFIARRKRARTPWELGRDLFGRFASGRRDLSTNRKKILREKLRAQASRRRRRFHRRPV